MSNPVLIDDLKRAGLYAANNNIGSVMSACDRGAEAIEAHEWRDIADAPRDGTTIILGKIGHSNTICIDSGITEKNDTPRVWWCGGGHWDGLKDKWSDGVDSYVTPTHYMPLPDAPKGGV